MSPARLTADLIRERPLPRPQEGSKESRGRILVIAGSVAIPGAALLAAEAAMRAGAGKLSVATTRTTAVQLALAVPEAMVIGLDETPEGGIAHAPSLARLRACVERADAVVIGPGMADEADAVGLAADLAVHGARSFVVDAAALGGLRARAEDVRSCGGPMIITPHAGEMARLLGRPREDVERDPLAAAFEAADLLLAHVVMKGAETHVVAPGGMSWTYSGGNVGLATSGSGDVLAGVIGGLLARGADAVTAALWGVYLHGECGRRAAGRRGPIGYLARELAGEIPALLCELG